MPIQRCPIEIPEGWEPVECRIGIHGEHCLHSRHPLRIDDDETDYPVLIIRRARPKLEVGDWVRLNRVGSTFHSTCGTVKQTNADGDFRVEFGSRGSGWVAGDLLIKQIRKIEPYTMDQCIAEIAERGSRRVVISCGAYTITRIGTNGAHIGDRFYVYDDASKLITWPNGDAFGVVKWEDAE